MGSRCHGVILLAVSDWDKNIPLIKELGPVSLFSQLRPRHLANTLTIENDILRFLRLDFVNMNVYAQFDYNIPFGSRSKASFTFT